ncbi:MAG: methyltransferase domain-containing protein [Parcubacteria group bacterium]|nr:methyltransferase domain-containing protein [Parcubacteria group bacterium]
MNNPKFINIDALPLPHIHYARDIRKLDVLNDDFADFLYASHTLEHVSHLELPKILKEWARVIKKGGTIRLSVPDFDKIIEIYHSSKNDIKSIKDPLMGGQDYAYNFHKSVFNEKYLSELLIGSGFHNIRKWDASKDNYGFNDFAKKFKGSINLEGDKT